MCSGNIFLRSLFPDKQNQEFMNSLWGNYRRLNTLTGWTLFVVSSIVYLLTLEPTVSFWDCGEFILSAFRLQVGHPPGAPLFLMIGRIATFFALWRHIKGSPYDECAVGNLQRTCHNVPFLDNNPPCQESICQRYRSLNKRIFSRIIGSGIIGALAYTFSDTFWFSAVEGELYALSSLVTGLVFWAMLKWEEEADQSYSGRWIILIAFIMGLGLGIHRLNLLVIPGPCLCFLFQEI